MSDEMQIRYIIPKEYAPEELALMDAGNGFTPVVRRLMTREEIKQLYGPGALEPCAPKTPDAPA